MDPNCNEKVAESYCHPLDSQLAKYLFTDSLDDAFLNNTGVPLDHLGVCKAVIKYKRCMDANFYIRCQRTFQQLFVKLDQMSTICLNAPNLKNSRAILNAAGHSAQSNILFSLLFIYFGKSFVNF
jgi:hypothetical protein